LWDPKTGKQKDAVQEFEKGRGIGAATPAESIDLLRFDPFGEKLSVAAADRNTMCRFPVGEKNRNFIGITERLGDYLSLKLLGLTSDGKYWLHSQERERNEKKTFHLLLTPNGLGEKDKSDMLFIFTRHIGEFQFDLSGPIEHAAADTPETVAIVYAAGGRTGPRTLSFWNKGSVFRGQYVTDSKLLWEVTIHPWMTEHMDTTGVLVSPGGKLVAVIGDAVPSKGYVWLFDAKTGKSAGQLGGFPGKVLSAAFSPDGKQIVAGCGDKTVRVYDTETGKELAVLKGHTEAVTTVAFSPGGDMIITGSSDKTVKVWEYRR